MRHIVLIPETYYRGLGYSDAKRYILEPLDRPLEHFNEELRQWIRDNRGFVRAATYGEAARFKRQYIPMEENSAGIYFFGATLFADFADPNDAMLFKLTWL